MFKNLSFIALCLLCMAGCGKKQSTGAHGTSQRDTKKKMFFDENVDAFVLEEDGNPFGFPENEPGIRLLSDDGGPLRDHEGEFEILYYEYDQAGIRADQQAVLARTVAKVRDAVKAGKTVVVEGHACTSGGSKDYNMHLSERRAKAVKDACVKAGVPAQRIKIVGRGDMMCKVPYGSRQQQGPNRRVETYTLVAERA